MSTSLAEHVPAHIVTLFERAVAGDVTTDELAALHMRELNLMLALTGLWLIDVMDRVEATIDSKPAREQRRIMAGIEEASRLIDEVVNVIDTDMAAMCDQTSDHKPP